MHGREGVLQLLLENGANVSSKRHTGATPLHEAVLRGHKANVRLLLERGADVSATTLGGITPLHWAGLRGAGPKPPALTCAPFAPDPEPQTLSFKP